MNITFNEKEQAIEIKDGLKFQYFLLKIMLIFIIVNAVLFPVFVLEKIQLEWMGFIWIIVGLASLSILIYTMLKKSTSEKLKLSEITSLTEKEVFGRKKFSFQLKNGRFRDLMELKKETDIREMKTLLENIGIKTS